MGFLDEWRRHGGQRPDKLGRFTIDADKWDVKHFEQMLEEMRKFDQERFALCENVPTGNGLWADAFNAFNKVDPQLVPPGKVEPRYLINRQVIQEAMQLPEFERLNNWTEGDPVTSAGACISMRPDFEELYDRTRTANEKAEELQEQMQELAKQQALEDDAQRDLDDLIEQWKNDHADDEKDESDDGDDGDDQQGGSGQDSQCEFCGAGIEQDDKGSWVDATGGDGCPGDDDGNNENGTHQPGGQGEGEGEGQGQGKPGKKPGKGKGGGKPQPGQGKSKQDKKIRDFQEQIQLIQAEQERIKADMDTTDAELAEEMAQNTGAVRQIMKEALANAADEYEAMQAVADMWGLDPGQLIRLSAEKRLDLARRMNNDRFKRMAELFGPMERLMHAEQRRKVNDIPEEVYDVGVGNDLERLLPAEYGKLAHPLRKLEFYKDFTEGKLLQYEMRGHDVVARGGIVCCIDNSGSMAGDRELWAKAIGLCLLHLSREQKRNFYGIHFGSYSELLEFDFEKEGYDVDRIIEFAEFFFNGGTNFDHPLTVALDKLVAEYNAKGAIDADIVFITDGQCGVQPDWLENFVSECKRIDATVWGILIDDPRWNDGLNKQMEPLHTICQGKVATVKDILSGKDISEMFGTV